MTNRTVRERLLASTIIAGAIVAATPALAQDAAGVAPPAPPSQPSGLQTTESTTPAPNSTGEIVVTGSLIRNPALTSSAPVQVIGQEEVQLRQSNVAEEVLRDLPGAVPSVGSAVNNGNGGASYVDLRGLGSFRNIVLLDGHRIAPSGLAGRVDLNDIPLALVQNVQALTGGAATTYGADAVAGVVNFITRSDFSGAEVNVGSQITAKGDGPYYRADVTIGANFDDGKGNAVLSLGYQHADAVYQGDRSYGANNIDSFAGVGTGSGTTVPGRLAGTGLGTLQINPATGALVPTYSLFNFNPYNIYETPFVRFNIYGAGHYDISDSIEVYARGMYSKNTVTTIVAPSGIFSSSIVIPYSNPYLPAAARTQLCGATAANVNNPANISNPYANGGALTAAQCSAAAAATSPTDPAFRAFTATVGRRITETGPRVSNFVTQFFDYRAGVKLSITESLKLDINGGYGESTNTQSLGGYVLTSRARAAAFATNTTSCLAGAPLGSSSAGCVPVNLFGPAGSITPDQQGYLTAGSTTAISTSLGQAQAVLNGDFGVASPFAHTAISFAVGGEYRKYTASQASDLLAQTPGELGGAGGAAPNIQGAYEVTEGFGEVIAPVVQDRPFFDLLQIEGGFRYSHYKVDAVGNPTYNTKTYKGALKWAPVPGFTFRGEYQRAVRAPNISELFTPVTTGLTTVTVDPCASFTAAGVRRQATPTAGSSLYNICIAQGATAGNIATIQNPTANQGNVTSGGNVNLQPEKSDSYTLGVVLQPRGALRGFSMTVDYYRIKIRGAISTPTSGDVLAGCFGPNYATANFTPTGTPGSAACNAIRRNPGTGQLDGDPGTTQGLIEQLSNLGTAFTDGIDVNANYRRDLGFAKLNLSFQGNWTNRSKFQASPTAINRECVGFYSANCGGAAGSPVGSIQPEFYWNQRTTLTFGAVDVSLLWRHINHVRQEPADVLANAPGFVGTLDASTGLAGKSVNFGKIPSVNYFDVATRLGVGENVDLTITVQNLLDKKPPIVGTGIGTTAFNSGNTYPSTYDALGRRFAVGARLKF